MTLGRRLLAAGVAVGLGVGPSGLGQAAKPRSDWTRVQAIAAGTDVEVRVGGRTRLCALKAVGEESLICVRGTPDLPLDLRYTRAEVDRVSIAKRTRSAIYGALIGTAIGTAAGGVQQTQSTRLGSFAGAFPLAYGFIGLFAGGPIGYFADFRRNTVYRVR